MNKLPKECSLYGCLLIRGKWETYGVYVDLGITPRAYLTVEGKNRYYLGLKFERGRWAGHVLLGVSSDDNRDSEKPLSDDLLHDQHYKKDELNKARDLLMVRGNAWIEENDGGMDRSMWEYEEHQVIEPKREDDEDV